MAGNTIVFEVAGTGFDGRQVPLRGMIGHVNDSVVTLVPDPKNEYDKNAIKVMVSRSGEEPMQVGFVPASIAPELLHRSKMPTPTHVGLVEHSMYGGKKKFGLKLTVPRVESND